MNAFTENRAELCGLEFVYDLILINKRDLFDLFEVFHIFNILHVP